MSKYGVENRNAALKNSNVDIRVNEGKVSTKLILAVFTDIIDSCDKNGLKKLKQDV